LKSAQSAKDLLQVVPCSDSKIEGGGEAFWLDSKTIGYVIEDKNEDKDHDSQSTLFAISISSPSAAGKPVPVGTFPSAVAPANFQYSAKASILVFTAPVYADGDLLTVQEQDKAYKNRGNTAKVYDVTYARHWDEWVGPKKSTLFTVSIKKDASGKWQMGEEFGSPLKGTGHVSYAELSMIPELTSASMCPWNHSEEPRITQFLRSIFFTQLSIRRIFKHGIRAKT
jgi:hypothetical protein